MERSTVAHQLNLSLIEDYYQHWLKDPESVDSSWRNFFEGYELDARQSLRRHTASESVDLRPRRRARRPSRG